MDAATVRAWATAAAAALDAARGPIDRLNVFPVPDGDTGTNLALTIAEAAEHVAEHVTGGTAGTGDPTGDRGAAGVAAAFARGALLGARGNSGVIMSQYLQGFADGLAVAHREAAGEAAGVAIALDHAQRAARGAVARPVEGTILTAATAAATAARTLAGTCAGPDAVVAAAVSGARSAVARSPQALDVLRAAGVVDAGASGLVVLLEALAGALGHPPVTAAGPVSEGAGPPAAGSGGPAAHAHHPTAVDHAHRAGPGPGPGPGHAADDGEFEVMYVVETHAPGSGPGDGDGAEPGDGGDLAPELSRRLQALGSSVAVVGGADGWHVHVHTDRPDAAVAAGGLGVRSQVVVRRLQPRATVDGVGHATPTSAAGRLGVVVGTGAPGLIADLARSGAVVLVHTGRPVTARAVRRAVVDTGAMRVVVLPGAPATLAAAQDAAAGSPVPVDVLDASDDLQVVVALAAGTSDTAGSAADRVAAMRAGLAAVRTGAVDSPDGGPVLAEVRRLLDDRGEVVTALVGAAAPGQTVDEVTEALAGALTDGLAATHPGVEVVVLPGGQHHPAVALAVE